MRARPASAHAHGDDIELDLPVHDREAVLGGQGRGPDASRVPVTLTIPPGTSSGAQAAAARRAASKRRTARAAIRSARVEIVAPKITPDDAETRKLFEEIAKRTAPGAGPTILIYLSSGAYGII